MEKNMIDGLRIWFLILYAVGIVVLLVKFIPARTHEKVIEKRVNDSRRLLPMICLPVDWLVPPLILLSGVGEVPAGLILIRVLGLGLSLYALVILVWVPRSWAAFWFRRPLSSPTMSSLLLALSESSAIPASLVPWLYGLGRRWETSTGYYSCCGFH